MKYAHARARCGSARRAKTPTGDLADHAQLLTERSPPAGVGTRPSAVYDHRPPASRLASTASGHPPSSLRMSPTPSSSPPTEAASARKSSWPSAVVVGQGVEAYRSTRPLGSTKIARPLR